MLERMRECPNSKRSPKLNRLSTPANTRLYDKSSICVDIVFLTHEEMDTWLAVMGSLGNHGRVSGHDLDP